jgi:hypothetical protein
MVAADGDPLCVLCEMQGIWLRISEENLARKIL